MLRMPFHPRNERRCVQPTNLEAPEICEGAEVLDVGFQTVCEERIMGEGD